MVKSRDQNAGHIHKLKMDNFSSERVKVFKYMDTALMNQNSFQEEIKSRLKTGNACYHSVRNPLSSRLLSKNICSKIYRTIILPVVTCGCESWSCTLREEHCLRLFKNRVLRRIFGPWRYEVTRILRKLCNGELNDLHSSPNIIQVITSRRMRWAEHVTCVGERRGAYRLLVGKPEGKRPLGRSRHRWKDNTGRHKKMGTFEKPNKN